MKASICVVGDICLAGEPERVLMAKAKVDLFRAVRSAGSEHTAVLGTVECAITDRGAQKPYKVCLRCSKKAARLLEGLDVGLLGNNHIQDYGDASAFDTVEAVRSVGVQPVGYGRNILEAMMPVVLPVGDATVAVISMCCITTRGENIASTETPGVAPISMSLVRTAIEAAKAQADLVLFCPHWGVQDERFPVPDQIRLARRAIDWGANAVVGTHAHVIQVYEQYRNAWIFYGLGNYLFGDIHSSYVSLDGQPAEKGWSVLQASRNLESLAVWLRPARYAGTWGLELIRLKVVRCGAEFDQTVNDIASSSLDFSVANARLKKFIRLNDNWMASDTEPAYSCRYEDGIPTYSYAQSPVGQQKGAALRSLSYARFLVRRVTHKLKRLGQWCLVGT